MWSAYFLKGGMGHFYRPGGDLVSSSSMLSSQMYWISNFTFFPSQGADLGGSDLHGLRIKISLEFHYLGKYTLGLILVLSRSLVAKYDRWEVSNGVPSILQQSTKPWVKYFFFLFFKMGENYLNCFFIYANTYY